MFETITVHETKTICLIIFCQFGGEKILLRLYLSINEKRKHNNVEIRIKCFERTKSFGKNINGINLKTNCLYELIL